MARSLQFAERFEPDPIDGAAMFIMQVRLELFTAAILGVQLLAKESTGFQVLQGTLCLGSETGLCHSVS
jgi:hypothetical protein